MATLLLAACTTPEEQAEARRLQQQQDHATCRSYGLKPGREAFATCLMQLDLARQQQYYYDSHSHYGVYHGFEPRYGTGFRYYTHY